MIRNRITFISTWAVGATALFVFPGFEIRGLACGMIVGYWPALLLSQIYESQHPHPIIFLLMMIILSGTTVCVCAWLMDKSGISKKVMPLLVCTMLLYACYLAFSGINYEEWQTTPAVAAAMESPEVNYEPTRWDFWNSIIIPKLLAGGLIGLYFISVLGGLFAMLVLFKRIIIPKATSLEPQGGPGR